MMRRLLLWSVALLLAGCARAYIDGWATRASGVHVTRGNASANFLGALSDCSSSQCTAGASVVGGLAQGAVSPPPTPAWQGPAGCTILPATPGCLHNQPGATSFTALTTDISRALTFENVLAPPSTPSPSVPSGSFRKNEWVGLADLDGDDDLDLIMYHNRNAGGLQVVVSLNDGLGTFTSTQTITLHGGQAAGVRPQAEQDQLVLLGDVDNDVSGAAAAKPNPSCAYI